jgi:signal transduction histidine kinase
MFARARRRLTLLYIGLIALVLGLFSLIFYIAITTVLAPAFDLAPELSSSQAAELAYRTTIERIGIALIVGNLLVVVLVGVIAWLLASWTLRPIREAHLRQRRFVADASHEMRTPLAAIRVTAEGAADAAGAGTATPDDLTTALRSVVDSTDRLTRLTNDLLLLARSDERLLAPTAVSTDLSVVVAEAVETFELARPGLLGRSNLKVELAPDLLVSADPDGIRRILANLLDNAVRYGGPAVRIRVTTSGLERDASLEVTDDGPGIAAADAERIFEPFYRVRADAAGPEGTGLGLALARGLAEREGGRLTVESKPGAGSRFQLTLPRFR